MIKNLLVVFCLLVTMTTSLCAHKPALKSSNTSFEIVELEETERVLSSYDYYNDGFDSGMIWSVVIDYFITDTQQNSFHFQIYAYQKTNHFTSEAPKKIIKFYDNFHLMPQDRLVFDEERQKSFALFRDGVCLGTFYGWVV